MKRVLGSIRRADERYHLFEDGDKVCIGVSGGKDSLLLMEALKLYQRFSKTKFEVCAVTLDLGIVEQDWSAVTAFAERIGMDYSLIKTDIGDVVFNIRQEKSPCALCAKLRRGALNNAARDRGCNKVALGHNREDVIETFFMSLLYEGRVNTFAPVTYLSRSDVTVIRPLVPDVEEKMIHAIANTEKYGLWDRMRLRYDHPLFEGPVTEKNVPANRDDAEE